MNSDLSPSSTSPIITFAEDRPLPGKIVVVGVGNAGGNAINRMAQSGMSGAELIAANTDIRALRSSQAPTKLQLGAGVTHGYGCGGVPELGRQAAPGLTPFRTRKDDPGTVRGSSWRCCFPSRLRG